jgi:hypothetical protein
MTILTGRGKEDLPDRTSQPDTPKLSSDTLLGEYFPKGTDIPDDPDYLWTVAREINGRPRKILGWKKPAEVFAELLTSGIASTG